MDKNTIFSAVFVLFFLTSCRSTPGDAALIPTPELQTNPPVVDPSPTSAPTTAIPTETPAPDPTQAGECPVPFFEGSSQRTQYYLYAYLGVVEQAGYFEETIVYQNTTGETLTELLLVVESSRTENAFSVNDILIGGQQAASYSLSGGYLRIPLGTALPDGCAVELEFEYHLEFPEQAGIFGCTDDQMVLSNWYPFLPPYIPGEGWLVHDPAGYGEHLVYPIADFLVTVDLAHPPEGVLVAAPAPAQDVDGAFRYSLEGARAFAVVVLSGYSVYQQQYNGIDVLVYTKEATIAASQSALSTAVDSLAFYEQILGPYPFESLSIVQLEMYDGMESDAIFYLSDDVFGTYNSGPRNMLTYLIPHEIGHNWWFSQVANDQALEPWLDEALATYYEKLFYEEVLPQHAAWWWEYRIDQWEPEGDVDATIYTYPAYETYRQAVYLRGVEFVHALRERMGDEAFLAFLRSYLDQGRYQIMTAEDFFPLLEAEYGVQVEDLLAEYFGGW